MQAFAENRADRVVIIRQNREKLGETLSRLDSSTSIIHFSSHPFIWILEYIIGHCPNVKQIELSLCTYRKLTEHHYALCREAGIELTIGHVRPNWRLKPGTTRRTRRYRDCKQFFETLNPDRLKLFKELVELGFESALMARDYYLGEETSLFLHDLCKRYGYSPVTQSNVSVSLNAVMKYLDPDRVVIRRAESRARVMREKVERLRAQLRDSNMRAEKARSLGIAMLPPEMPLSHLDELELVVEAKRLGWLDDLQKLRPKQHRALVTRYDIRDPNRPVFRTLEETLAAVADEEPYRTRERTRQHVERALQYLRRRKAEK